MSFISINMSYDYFINKRMSEYFELPLGTAFLTQQMQAIYLK